MEQQDGVTSSNWDVEIGYPSTDNTASNQSWNNSEGQLFMRAIAKEYDSDNLGYYIVTQFGSMFTQLTSISSKCLHLDCLKTKHIFNQQKMYTPESALLLENKSTVNYICNTILTTNIHRVNKQCIIYTNAGTSFTNQKGTLKMSIIDLGGDILFDLNGIANIIALHIV